MRSGREVRTVVAGNQSVLQGHEVVLNLWWKNLCVFHSRWVVGGENGLFPSVLPVTNIARIGITNKSESEVPTRTRAPASANLLSVLLFELIEEVLRNFSYYGAGSFR